jgi:gluconolactonase
MAGFGSDLDVVDKRFYDLVIPNAWLERLYEGCRWAEGPVWFGDGQYLVWSDIPNRRMLRWVEGLGVGIFRADSNYANGNTLDRQGRLVTCEHGGRRVTRTEPDGAITVLADSFAGKRLNSPNDVVVKSDGSVWFTDPPYGILSDYEGFKAPQEQEGCFVYRLDPATGELGVATRELRKPNGLAFSPDESILYVAESGASHDPGCPRHILAFPVESDGRLGRSRVFAEVTDGLPDGFRVDVEGHVWTSAGQGVECFDPKGDLLGRIRLPEVAANVTFGGPRRNRLFITATSSLYAIFVATAGAQAP